MEVVGAGHQIWRLLAHKGGWGLLTPSCLVLQTIFPVRTADGGPDTLASIAQVSNTSLTDTRPLAKKLNHLYQELFNHTGLLQSSSSFSFPDGQEMESRRGFSGLLAGDNINTVISLLDHAYEKVGPSLPAMHDLKPLKVHLN